MGYLNQCMVDEVKMDDTTKKEEAQVENKMDNVIYSSKSDNR